MKLAILLPGLLDSPNYINMEVFSKRLQESGFETIVIDPAGLWRNDGNISEYSITNYINEVDEIINLNKDNVDDIILLGHSKGAYVALLAAAKNQYISKIIGIGIPVKTNNSADKWNEDGIRVSKREEPYEKGKMREFKLPISFLEDASQYKLLEIIPYINIPILNVICEKDDIVSPEESLLLDSLGKDNIETITVPGIGHDYIKNLEESEKIWSYISDFI